MFVVHGTRDDLPAGPFVRLDADGTVRVGESPVVAGGAVVAVRRRGQPPPHFPNDRPHARLVNGDRIPGRVVSVADDRLRFLADLGVPQELTIPLSAVAAVWLTDTAALRAATLIGQKTLAEKRRQDVVVLSNGDTARGTLLRWPAGGPLQLDVAGKEADVQADRVQAVLLNSDLARAPKPRGAYRQLVLTNGCRLSVRTAELAGNDLRATTLTGSAVRVPVAAVAALNVYQGPAVYLSDLAPRYEHTSYLGVGWPVVADHSVSGLELRLGGGTYDKGVGMHSQSRATYAVPAGARRLEAVVGLDEVTGRRGNVVVRVLADGKPLLDPAELMPTDAPRPLRLPLPAGAKELTLAVDFGRGGDVQDEVDWADARFVLTGAPTPLGR
jgi:hypothetical protein